MELAFTSKLDPALIDLTSHIKAKREQETTSFQFDPRVLEQSVVIDSKKGKPVKTKMSKNVDFIFGSPIGEMDFEAVQRLQEKIKDLKAEDAKKDAEKKLQRSRKKLDT